MQEQNSIPHAHGGSPEDYPNACIVRGLHEYLRGRRLGKKDGAIVLKNSFGGEASAGFLPFDDLGVDGIQTLVLKAISGRTRGGYTAQHGS